MSLAVMVFTFVNFQMRISDLEKSLGDNPFAKSISNIALQTVQLQWGWAVLVIGAIMLIVAAALKRDNPY